MNPTTDSAPTNAPPPEPQKAVAVQPAPVAPPSPNRVTIEHLLQVGDSVKREAWISALVEAEVARQNFAQDRALAREFAISGQFSDINGQTMEQSVSTAMVKIQLGRAWGFNAADSIRYIFFTNGKPSVENEIVAAKLQQAGISWDVEWLEDEVDHKGRKVKKCVGCTLWLRHIQEGKVVAMTDRHGQPLSVSFTQFDADTALIWEKGKQIPLSEKWNFKSWPRDMFYWRAVSRVKKYHAPQVLRGAVSREEALDTVPLDSLPPETVPPALQALAQPPEQSAKPRVADIIMGQESFLEAPPSGTTESTKGKT